jgi:hypothetical protein
MRDVFPKIISTYRRLYVTKTLATIRGYFT